MDWLAMEAAPLDRMGEWLDAHPRTALAVLVALMLLASVRW